LSAGEDPSAATLIAFVMVCHVSNASLAMRCSGVRKKSLELFFSFIIDNSGLPLSVEQLQIPWKITVKR